MVKEIDGSQPEDSRSDLTERLADVAASYEKFLAVHFVKAAEALTARAPEFCEISGFRESWNLVGSLKRGVLAQAVRQPMLDLWVKTSERLLELGVYERYPHAHFVRHLKDFARLLLSWAGAAPDGAEGTVHLLGRRFMPLMFGRLLLEVKGYSEGEVLRWRVTDRVLRIGLGGKTTLAEISLSGGTEARLLKSRAGLLKPPVVGGAVADIWTPEYTGGSNVAVTEESLRQEARRIQAALTEEHVSSIARFCRALTVATAGRNWVAGLVRLSPPLSEVTPAYLVERAHRDCLERLLRLIPLGEVYGPLTFYGDPHKLLVELGARRITSRLLGERLSEPDASRWEGVASHLRTSTPGQNFLRAVAEEGEPSDAPPSSGAEAPVPLAGVLKASGVESPSFGRLQLLKTRRAAMTPTDWRALDSLQYLTHGELEQIYRSAVNDCASSEASAYCAAVSSYILGEFKACQRALLHCLRHDGDVEEYWHLLAFTMRYLDQAEGFNSIVFGNERELSSFAFLPGIEAQ